MDEVAELLQATLDEEGATDKALTGVAEEISGNNASDKEEASDDE